MLKPGLRDWLRIQINSEKYKGLKWIDKTNQEFMILWKHGSKRSWKQDEDALLFKDWAVHKNKYHEGKECNARKLKSNFRCALEQSQYFARCESKEKVLNLGEKIRIYRFTKEDEKKGSRKSAKAKKSNVTSTTKGDDIVITIEEENCSRRSNDITDTIIRESISKGKDGNSPPFEITDKVDDSFKTIKSIFDVHGNIQTEWRQSEKRRNVTSTTKDNEIITIIDDDENCSGKENDMRGAFEKKPFFKVSDESSETTEKVDDLFKTIRSTFDVYGNIQTEWKQSDNKKIITVTTKGDQIVTTTKEKNCNIKENNMKESFQRETLLKSLDENSAVEINEKVEHLFKRIRSTFDIDGNAQTEWKQSDKFSIIKLFYSLLNLRRAKYYDYKCEENIMHNRNNRDKETIDIKSNFSPVTRDFIKEKEKCEKTFPQAGDNDDEASEYYEFDYIYSDEDQSDEDNIDEENKRYFNHGNSNSKSLRGLLEEDKNNNHMLHEIKDIEKMDEILFSDSEDEKKYNLKACNEEPTLHSCAKKSRRDVPDLIEYLDENSSTTNKLWTSNNSIFGDGNRNLKLSFLNLLRSDKLITLINY